MRVYTVHMRDQDNDPDRDIVLVREGFSWAGFILTVVWALWHRLWWVAVGVFAVGTAGGVLESAAPDLGVAPVYGMIVTFLVSVFVGLFGNDWVRWGLRRRGYATAAVVAARDRDEALRRFLDIDPAYGNRRVAA